MNRISVRPSRSPFQFALVAVSAVSGFLGLVMPDPAPSRSVLDSFGLAAPWFYLALLASSLIVFAGMVWPRTTVGRFTVGLQIERIGLYPLAGSTLAFAAATLAMSGRTAIVAALLIGGIGAASLVRIRIITIDLHRIATLLIIDSIRGRP